MYKLKTYMMQKIYTYKSFSNNTIYLLGVQRIVIFAEYSAECSLPKPNILPYIRHAEYFIFKLLIKNQIIKALNVR